MGADLLRQRRNLLVISLGLMAIELAGATFENKVSILGAGITFDHPERLITGAWVLWLYFLVRYFQYLHDEPDLGLRKGMENWICRKFPMDRDIASQQVLRWNGWLQWELSECYGDEDVDEHWGSVHPKNRWVIVACSVRSFVYVALRTPRFTDYLLPMIVAFLPVGLRTWAWVMTEL